MNIEKLRKIWALADSPQPGEAKVARQKAEQMVAEAGYTLADVPALLNQPPLEKRPILNPFDGFDEFMEREEPGYKTTKARERVDKRTALAAYRESIITRYGSEAAALAPTPMERIIMAAVQPYAELFSATSTGRLEIQTAPKVVLDAVKAAIPMPESIVKAKAEYDKWEERDRELGALHWDEPGETYLSPACYLRREMLLDLVRTGIRAASLEDVLVRQQWFVNRDFQDDDGVDRAVLADLEHLERQRAPVQNGQAPNAPIASLRTASERRVEIIRLLSNLDTRMLSDREIARRVGCSPQTVSNVRKRCRQSAT
jgi:Homeodomain-like domain